MFQKLSFFLSIAKKILPELSFNDITVSLFTFDITVPVFVLLVADSIDD